MENKTSPSSPVLQIDFTEYELLKEQFDKLEDNNFETAFFLRKRSASLAEYFGTKLAEAEKLKAKARKTAEGKEAEIMREYIEKYKVSRGREEYKADPRIVPVNEEYFDLIEICKKLETILKYLSDVYYISQSIYERGTRAYGKN